MDAAMKDKIAARLQKIAELNGGRLTPDAILQDAKSVKSPLHDQFDWNDSTASHQWRLMQARELVRSVKIEFTTDTKIVSTVRYVRDPSAGDEQGYVDVAKLRGAPEMARDALLSELRSARALFERAFSLAEVLGLSDEFSELQNRVELLHGKLDKAA